LSITVTVWLQVDVLPLLSVAVQTTVLIPTGKVAAALLVIVVAPQLSVAPANPRKTPVALHAPAPALTVTGGGQVITGGTLSTTVTVCVQVAKLPLLSVTVQVTLVVPMGKLAGASFVMLAIPQLSNIIGMPRNTLAAVQPEFVVVLILAGQNNVG
jgi:hypothetical protein